MQDQDKPGIPNKSQIEKEFNIKANNTVPKLKILNEVLQSPWRPTLPYNFRPSLRKHIGTIKSSDLITTADKRISLNVCNNIITSDDNSSAERIQQIFAKKEEHNIHIRRQSHYTCDECQKSFSQLRNFKYHMSVHRGTMDFATTCPVCGKLFNDRGYLSSHMKIHRNRKEYKCSFCPKSFNQRVAYNMHVKIHTGVKPHACEDCGKAFSRKMLLKQHKRTHSGERPYACSFCNKRFADRSNMTLHLRLHTGIKPFSCYLCSKTFTKKHHLTSHLNYHTGDKPYSCPLCELAFTQSSNMRTHYKKCLQRTNKDV